MSELDFRKYVCTGLDRFGHTNKIESTLTASGFPDINYCIEGIEGNIELKYDDPGKKLKIRPSQKRWFRQRLRAGGNCFLLGRFASDRHILLDGKHVSNVGSSMESWMKYRMFYWDGPIGFAVLAGLLTSRPV